MTQATTLKPVKQSFIPLITGMLAIKGLRVQGLSAIPVYLITAETARKVIDRLEPVVAVQPSVQPSDLTSQQATLADNNSAQADLPMVPSPDVKHHIVHAVPGRVRFRIPRIANDRAYVRRLERLIKSEPCVENVRVNCAAASIVVTYTGKVTDAEMHSLLARLIQTASQTVPIASVATLPSSTTHSNKVPALTAATRLLAQKQADEAVAPGTDYPTGIAAQPASSEPASLWVDLKPPALSAILALMANLY